MLTLWIQAASLQQTLFAHDGKVSARFRRTVDTDALVTVALAGQSETTAFGAVMMEALIIILALLIDAGVIFAELRAVASCGSTVEKLFHVSGISRISPLVDTAQFAVRLTQTVLHFTCTRTVFATFSLTGVETAGVVGFSIALDAAGNTASMGCARMSAVDGRR